MKFNINDIKILTITELALVTVIDELAHQAGLAIWSIGLALLNHHLYVYIVHIAL